MTQTLVTRPQLAARFGVSKETIVRWEKSGKLVPIRLSTNTVRYALEQVEQFIAGATK